MRQQELERLRKRLEVLADEDRLNNTSYSAIKSELNSISGIIEIIPSLKNFPKVLLDTVEGIKHEGCVLEISNKLKIENVKRVNDYYANVYTAEVDLVDRDGFINKRGLIKAVTDIESQYVISITFTEYVYYQGKLSRHNISKVLFQRPKLQLEELLKAIGKKCPVLYDDYEVEFAVGHARYKAFCQEEVDGLTERFKRGEI